MIDMNDKLLSFLGLCRRAGKLVIGAEVTAESLKTGRSKLVIYAEDFSRGSLKKVLEAAEGSGTEALCLNRSKEQLSFALGRLSGVVSIEDEGFAKKLRAMISNEQRGEFDEI